LSAYSQQDFEAIEAAVLESPRGRWFLSEFTRRNRAADTLMLLDAIAKLERGLVVKSPHQVSDELAAELQSLSDAIGAMLAGEGEASEDKVLSAVEQLSEVKRRIDGLVADRSGGEAADGALSEDRLRYFRDDEDLFEAGPAHSALQMQPQPQAPKSEMTAPRGDPKDRIVFIRRASSRETSIPLADEAEGKVG
jgi:hypothetical protein